MKIINLILLSSLFFMVACSETPVISVDENERTKEDNTDNNSIVHYPSSTKSIEEATKVFEFRGYVGTSPITLSLNLEDEDNITGTYSYDKYSKPINLKGEYVSCKNCGAEGLDCQKLVLAETAEDGGRAEWVFECFDHQLYDYPHMTNAIKGEWKNTESRHRISLIGDSSSDYLEPNSQFIFESEEQANQFFGYHEIHNRQVADKKFYVFAKDYSLQYEHMLPAGITLYEFNGDVVEYVLDDQNNFVKGEEQFSMFDLPTKKVSNEIMVCVFDEMDASRLFTGSYMVWLSELKEYDYYVQDEHSWLLSKSGSVLGYYLTNQLPFYAEPSDKSEIVFNSEVGEDAFIHIRDIQFKNLEYWAQVELEFYTNIPCSDEVVEPKPSQKGWIKLYNNDGELNIYHYSGGC